MRDMKPRAHIADVDTAHCNVQGPQSARMRSVPITQQNQKCKTSRADNEGTTVLQEQAEHLQQQHGVEVLTSGADLCDAASIRDMVAQTQRRLGDIDILVNNAGQQYVAPVHEFPGAHNTVWRAHHDQGIACARVNNHQPNAHV